MRPSGRKESVVSEFGIIQMRDMKLPGEEGSKLSRAIGRKWGCNSKLKDRCAMQSRDSGARQPGQSLAPTLPNWGTSAGGLPFGASVFLSVKGAVTSCLTVCENYIIIYEAVLRVWGAEYKHIDLGHGHGLILSKKIENMYFHDLSFLNRCMTHKQAYLNL